MKVLAIDTSCDDTSVAVVEKKNNRIKAISNIVSSQIKIHAPYGGVYPMLAKREHQRNLPLVLARALKQAKLLKVQSLKFKIQNCNSRQKTLNKILERDPLLLEKMVKFLAKYGKPAVDAIAVTNTPGLEPCLWQGINFAKALSFWWGLPIIPVNHIKAHLAANWLFKEPSALKRQRHSVPCIVKFPAIGLVASGGHTELIYMPKIETYKIIGSTRDDASGECFDKTARILGLGYPGGPAIATETATFNVQSSKFKVELPRPMITSNDFDFSFSGLKTAVLYNFQSQKKITQGSQDYKTAMAKEIQQAIIDVLVEKTFKAAKQFNAKSIVLGGGVIANKELRKQLKIRAKKEKLNLKIHFPAIKLCMDNAAMVGAESLLSKIEVSHKPNWPASNASGVANAGWQKIQANGNLDI